MAYRNVAAPLHAAEILLHLPRGEYRLALKRMAEYLKACVLDPDLTLEQTGAVKATLYALEKRLN
jgi:hypothetical protein